MSNILRKMRYVPIPLQNISMQLSYTYYQSEWLCTHTCCFKPNKTQYCYGIVIFMIKFYTFIVFRKMGVGVRKIE